jgi:hypothetical protein
MDDRVNPKVNLVTIKAPNFQVATIKIVGTAPYVANKMAARIRDGLIQAQMLGSQSKNKKKRKPKDFNRVFEEAQHVSTDGWKGMPASAFRSALVSACRTVGYPMVKAKLSIFVEAEGFDADDGQPLIRIIGTPERVDMAVRLSNGAVDIMPRPMWKKWSAKVTLRWDADQFSATDITSLLARVGLQVGIGAGRPDSKESTGMGWGLFEVRN